MTAYMDEDQYDGSCLQFTMVGFHHCFFIPAGSTAMHGINYEKYLHQGKEKYTTQNVFTLDFISIHMLPYALKP